MSSRKVNRVSWRVILMLLAAVAGLATLSLDAFRGDPGTVMTVEDAYTRSRAGEVVLVDVRRPDEWRASGLPATAHAITMHQNRDDFLRQLLVATGGRKDRPLAVICATGGRTTSLQPLLREAGFTKLFNVAEGMFGSGHGAGWLKKRLPVQRLAGSGARRP